MKYSIMAEDFFQAEFRKEDAMMLLNSIQAKKIFDKYSFLIGSEDVMSTIKATALFGKEAILYALQNRPEETSILDDAGNGYEHIYLTYAGVRQAVTFCNRKEICQLDKARFGDKPPSLEDVEWHEVKENSKIISFEERRKQA